MKRKIIKQAEQAYTITLPIRWVRENKLNEKSEVDVEESGKSLMINSGNKVSCGKVKLELNDASEKRSLYLHIGALYARGIDEIELESSEELTSEIASNMNNFIGYAIISRQKNKITIKDIGGTSYSDLDEIFKRVFQIILLFYEDAYNDILGKEKQKIENLRQRDLEVNKFCLFLQRAINKKMYSESSSGRALFTYAIALEEVGDEIFRLWRTNMEHKIVKNKEVIELMDITKEALGEAFDIYYQFNVKKLEKTFAVREKTREKIFNMKINNAASAIFIKCLLKIIEELADLSHLVLMLKLDKKEEK